MTDLSIQHTIETKLACLDLQTARELVSAADKANACARGWIQLLKGTLERPLNEGRIQMLINMTIQLATKGGQVSQISLALHHLLSGDDGRDIQS